MSSCDGRRLTTATIALHCRYGNRQALNYPEVQARKCLVKNVLREEDLVSVAPAEDPLMPTIQIASLRELAVKLPGPCYPSDAPPTPTTPAAEAHDANP